MNTSSFVQKLTRNRKPIIRALILAVLIRSIWGIGILAIPFFFGWDLLDIVKFEILGLRIHFLILPVIATLVLIRLRRVYKWWITLE